MAQQLFSPSWYRVAKLTPLLRPHAQGETLEGRTVLVDCGPTVLQGLKRLQVSPEQVDAVLLSHQPRPEAPPLLDRVGH